MISTPVFTICPVFLEIIKTLSWICEICTQQLRNRNAMEFISKYLNTK